MAIVCEEDIMNMSHLQMKSIIEEEVQETTTMAMLFRPNNLRMKQISSYFLYHMKTVLRGYLDKPIAQIAKCKNASPDVQTEVVTVCYRSLLTSLHSAVSSGLFPDAVFRSFDVLIKELKDKFENENSSIHSENNDRSVDEELKIKVAQIWVGGLFFNRIVCPSIVTPSRIGLPNYDSQVPKDIAMEVVKRLNNYVNALVNEYCNSPPGVTFGNIEKEHVLSIMRALFVRVSNESSKSGGIDPTIGDSWNRVSSKLLDDLINRESGKSLQSQGSSVSLSARRSLPRRKSAVVDKLGDLQRVAVTVQADTLSLAAMKDVLREEIEETETKEMLFRANSQRLKLISAYLMRHMRDFLHANMKRSHRRIRKCSAVLAQSANMSKYEKAVTKCFDSTISGLMRISSSASFPINVRTCLRVLCESIQTKFYQDGEVDGDYDPASVESKVQMDIAGLMFLRVICPAIISPDRIGLPLYENKLEMEIAKTIVKKIQSLVNTIVSQTRPQSLDTSSSDEDNNRSKLMEIMLSFFARRRSSTLTTAATSSSVASDALTLEEVDTFTDAAEDNDDDTSSVGTDGSLFLEQHQLEGEGFIVTPRHLTLQSLASPSIQNVAGATVNTPRNTLMLSPQPVQPQTPTPRVQRRHSSIGNFLQFATGLLSPAVPRWGSRNQLVNQQSAASINHVEEPEVSDEEDEDNQE